MHIVSYTCECCGAEQSQQAGFSTDGMCPLCENPMRIRDLFADRRIVSVPVQFDRREFPQAEAA